MTGGQTFAPEELMALQLPPIIRLATERQGEPPSAITLTIPANWSEHRRRIFTNAVSSDHLPPLNIITEPEAAAIHYAENERIEPGEIVAVYDLGGGTFDTAILRRTTDGFEVLGQPEGIDRLGGIDFDAAVYSHVNRTLDGTLDDLDLDDTIVTSGLAQLRVSCVEAKEALSEESDTEIPVMLPGLRTEIRMTRSELEAMIRPALSDSIGALRRALSSANVSPEDVTVVLLVGGSSRIPLVAQLVSTEFGRPVAVDAHPKHAIALGAALSPHPAMAASPAAPVSSAPVVASPTPPIQQAPPVEPTPAAVQAPAAEGSAPVAAAFSPPDQRKAGSAMSLPLVGGIVALLVLAGSAFFLLSNGDGGTETAAALNATTATTTAADTTTTAADTTTAAPTTSEAPTTTTTEAPTTTSTTTTTLPPNPCDALNAPFVCMDDITVDPNGTLSIRFSPVGFTPNISSDHIHFFFNTPQIMENLLNAGTGGPNAQSWVVWDVPNPATPFTLEQARASGATELCALIAGSLHTVNLGTGHCTDISDLLG